MKIGAPLYPPRIVNGWSIALPAALALPIVCFVILAYLVML